MSFSFADARWIYPRLPDGGGAMGLRIQTLPRGILWLVTDARLRAPGTNLAGTFGVVTGAAGLYLWHLLGKRTATNVAQSTLRDPDAGV